MKSWSLARKWILALALLVPVNLIVTGCTMLSDAQAQKVEVISAQLKSLQADYAALREQMLAVIKKAQAGEIPWAEATSLLSTLGTREAEIRGKVDAAVQAYNEAKDSGVSPWMIVGSVLLNLVQGGGLLKLLASGMTWKSLAVATIEGVEVAVKTGQDVKEACAQAHEDAGLETFAKAQVHKVTRKGGV